MEISKKKRRIHNLKVKANKVNKKWRFNQNNKAKQRTIILKGERQKILSNLKNLNLLMNPNLR